MFVPHRRLAGTLLSASAFVFVHPTVSPVPPQPLATFPQQMDDSSHLPLSTMTAFPQFRMQQPDPNLRTEDKEPRRWFLGEGLRHMLQLPFLHHPLEHGTLYQSCRYVEPGYKRSNLPQIGSTLFCDRSESMYSLSGGNGLVRVTPRDGKSDLEEEEEVEERDGGSENVDRPVIEEGRPYRRKKKFVSEPSCCPACGVTVRPQELGQHFSQELDRLYKVGAGSRSRGAARNSQDGSGNGDGTPQARWETYKRIRANRQARIRTKNRKRKADEPPSCPICNERLSGTAEELNRHVEGCLNRQNNDGSNSSVNNVDEEEVDVEGGNAGGFEEYEWAGQRRVRASSMLDGGFSAVGLATSSSHKPQDDEEEVDLIVDGDSSEFGAAQYSESDVITPLTEGSSREQKERDALREAVISPNISIPSNPTSEHDPTSSTLNGTNDSRIEAENSKPKPKPRIEENGCCSLSSIIDNEGEDGRKDRLVVEALRERVRELEAEMRAVGFKCLICMEQYKKPVTSVCCWHVHCEQCWLHTLGAKKLCPQCNMITSPSDLRRIYM